MSYKVTINENGVSFPRFYCDICRKPIDDLTLGNTIFNSEIPGNTAHVHKLCELPGGTKKAGYNNWHPLTADLVYLLRNYGWLDPEGNPTEKLEEAVREVERFSGL
jgi:hypothetical protein